MVSSTVGSLTSTGWKRRSRAASFSMYLRYSSSVVAPMACSSPRARAGFSMLPASSELIAAGAGAHDGVQLVDEQDDAALALLHLAQHGLQTVLELAAVLRAGHHRTQIERDDLAILQRRGNVAGHDALGQPLHDGRLAGAGLADEHRVVLGAAGQHLDGAANFLVTADDRVQLALASLLSEVLAELLQGLELGLVGLRR